MNPNEKGTKLELEVCAKLIEEGYYVFRNVGPHGPIDIVAVKGDETRRLDVKSPPFPARMSEIQTQLGVEFVSIERGALCFMVLDTFADRYCVICGEKFTPRLKTQCTCGQTCNGKWGYLQKRVDSVLSANQAREEEPV